MENTIEIPEGYEARIEGNKVILEPKDEDAETRRLIRVAINNWFNSDGMVYEKESVEEMKSRCLAYLEKQGSQNLANSEKTCKDEQNSAWSDEDEKMLDKCIEYASNIIAVKSANYCGLFVDFKRIPDEKAQDWLRTLKERYTWKPSDEQMQALEHVSSEYAGSWTPELLTLFDDLKKLKG